jgi:DNA-binding response OmpR family regulator
VVEDDPDGRQRIQDRLPALGYCVQSEVDGARALKAVQTEMFEGMILSIDIPSMDGMDVLWKIRRSDQQIPIVMVAVSGVVVLYPGLFEQIRRS